MTQDEQQEILITLKVQVNELHARLLGNGQPGELQKLDGRLRAEEDATSRLKGAIAAVVLFGTILSGIVSLHLLKLL